MTRVGIEPTTCGLTYHLGFRRPPAGPWSPTRGSWSGLSLCLHQQDVNSTSARGQAPAVQSLHLPWPIRATMAWLGVGIPAFPDFDGIHRAISDAVLLFA
jgi:hypothetical protein